MQHIFYEMVYVTLSDEVMMTSWACAMLTDETMCSKEEILHLIGTIFSGGLIHIWFSSEYLWQKDGVCGTESK